MTASKKFSNCIGIFISWIKRRKIKNSAFKIYESIVPKDAYIEYVRTRKVGLWINSQASLNGGTMIWISGKSINLTLQLDF